MPVAGADGAEQGKETARGVVEDGYPYALELVALADLELRALVDPPQDLGNAGRLDVPGRQADEDVDDDGRPPGAAPGPSIFAAISRTLSAALAPAAGRSPGLRSRGGREKYLRVSAGIGFRESMKSGGVCAPYSTASR